jgi:hypothetical protein
MLTMLAWFVPGILSYVYWHKKMKLDSNREPVEESKKETVLSY